MRTKKDMIPFSYQETVDHFAPHSLFECRCLDWLNLVYCCDRCNNRKGDRWPDRGKEDAIDLFLRRKYPDYVPVGSHVSPSLGDGNRPANEFFRYNFETGQIMPAECLDPVALSMAVRTIHDMDLNDYRVSKGYARSQQLLPYRRILRVKSLEQARIQYGDSRETRGPLLEMARSPSAYSGLTRAYLLSSIPGLTPTDFPD